MIVKFSKSGREKRIGGGQFFGLNVRDDLNAARQEARNRLASRIFELADLHLDADDADWLRRWAHAENGRAWARARGQHPLFANHDGERLVRIVAELRPLIDDDVECQMNLGSEVTGIDVY
ncbi:MAG: hypothetical protein WC683_07035 [bacterium]